MRPHLRPLGQRCMRWVRLMILGKEPGEVKPRAVAFYNKEGWVGCASKEVLRSAELSGLTGRLKRTFLDWESSCTQAWFETLRFYPRVNLVKLAFDKEIPLESRRQMSAAAILFDFHVPSRLWVLDLDVVATVVRYHLLTARMACVVDAPVGYALWITPTGLEGLCKQLSASATLLSVLALARAAPNYWVLKMLLVREGALKDQTDVQIKKALTACYARVGVWIPRDYFLVDDEVCCLVHRVGYYAPPKRAVLKVVS